MLRKLTDNFLSESAFDASASEASGVGQRQSAACSSMLLVNTERLGKGSDQGSFSCSDLRKINVNVLRRACLNDLISEILFCKPGSFR